MAIDIHIHFDETLNESPSEKEGKYVEFDGYHAGMVGPSMKVPPKRKGNVKRKSFICGLCTALNESPSEKEGK